MYRERNDVVYDLKFARRGIKRWAVRYRYNMYKCSECRTEITMYSERSRFGWNLRAFVVYLLIELRLSNQKAAEHSSLLFDVPLSKNNCADIKIATPEGTCQLTGSSVLSQRVRWYTQTRRRGSSKAEAITSGCLLT